MMRRPPISTLFPTRRSSDLGRQAAERRLPRLPDARGLRCADDRRDPGRGGEPDRKSTRLNSSHVKISYAVFCLKKKRPGIRLWDGVIRRLLRASLNAVLGGL